MSEFCVNCSAKEADIEFLTQKLWETRQQLAKALDEVDKLSFDLAFYQGNITNLSCNNK